MESLRKKALQIGKDTAFSASEAADAIDGLLKAGVSIPDVLNGGAEAVTNLAAATGADLATSTDIAVAALNSFHLSAKDLKKVVDQMTGAVNGSAADIGDFKEALAQSSSTAAQSGESFSDLAFAIAAMANSGVKGSDAGTSLKQMMVTLLNPTNKAKEAMKDLGLWTEKGGNAFINSEGKLRPFNEIVKLLRDHTKGLTDAQKTQAFATIGGTDAMRAYSIMAGLTDKQQKLLNDSISKTDAGGVAKTRMDNLKGSWEQFKGSLETAEIIIGEKVIPIIKRLVDNATAWINNTLIPAIDTLTGWWRKNKDTVTDLAKVFLETFKPAAKDAKKATDDLSTAQDKLSNKFTDLAILAGNLIQWWIETRINTVELMRATYNLLVAFGFIINAIDRVSGGSGHAGDALVRFGRDGRRVADRDLAHLREQLRKTKEDLAALKNKRLSVSASLKLNFSPSFTQKDWVAVRAKAGRMHTGGPVGGRPSGRDSQLRWLDPDEHVWTGKEVAAAGGHSRIEQWRKDVLRGSVPWMAAGGPVGTIGNMVGAISKVQNAGVSAIMKLGLTGLLRAFADFFGATGAGGLPGFAALGKQMAATLYHWVGSQWAALFKLGMGESGWRNTAQNPRSTAFGIGQFLNSTWAMVGMVKTLNPGKQILGFLKYIKLIYGDPIRAFAAWSSRIPHWYGKGLAATLFTKPTLIGVGEAGPETVSITPGRNGAGGMTLVIEGGIQIYGMKDAADVKRAVQEPDVWGKLIRAFKQKRTS